LIGRMDRDKRDREHKGRGKDEENGFSHGGTSKNSGQWSVNSGQ